MDSTFRRLFQISLLSVSLALVGCEFANKSTTAPSPADSPPAATIPAATMAAGSGFIFEGAQTTGGPGSDRDIWWNAATVVPSHSGGSVVTMASLGQVSDLTMVGDLDIAAMTSDERVPEAGEAFALEIRRPQGGEPQYALVRFTEVGVGESRDLAFEYIYPR